jgi:protein-L-isoaspartate(D-aspartate) O-methyltransferase
MRDTRRQEREEMVAAQLRARGIHDRAVLHAMTEVPRHYFVPEPLTAEAYADRPLPIGFNQTISQPYVVAYMTEALDVQPDDVVLEIGTGSGYQTAVLAALAREVISIEVVPELADRARQAFDAAGVVNARVLTGNSWSGCPERAPFPRIIVTTAPAQVPQPLVDQLAVNGTLVVPVGINEQELMVVTRCQSGIAGRRALPVRGVPTAEPEWVGRQPDRFQVTGGETPLVSATDIRILRE